MSSKWLIVDVFSEDIKHRTGADPGILKRGGGGGVQRNFLQKKGGGGGGGGSNHLLWSSYTPLNLPL